MFRRSQGARSSYKTVSASSSIWFVRHHHCWEPNRCSRKGKQNKRHTSEFLQAETESESCWRKGAFESRASLDEQVSAPRASKRSLYVMCIQHMKNRGVGEIVKSRKTRENFPSALPLRHHDDVCNYKGELRPVKALNRRKRAFQYACCNGIAYVKYRHG